MLVGPWDLRGLPFIPEIIWSCQMFLRYMPARSNLHLRLLFFRFNPLPGDLTHVFPAYTSPQGLTSIPACVIMVSFDDWLSCNYIILRLNGYCFFSLYSWYIMKQKYLPLDGIVKKEMRWGKMKLISPLRNAGSSIIDAMNSKTFYFEPQYTFTVHPISLSKLIALSVSYFSYRSS